MMNALNKISGNRRRTSRGRCQDGTPNPIDKYVGERIRLRRTLMGMSQERLGELLGLTFQQVQKYERGANRVGASRLYDLSNALNVPVSFFYDGMPDEVMGSSPAAMVAGDATLTTCPDAENPMAKRETLELVRAYYAIPNATMRRRLYDMAKTMAEMGQGG